MRDRFKFRVWKGLENRMVDNVTHLNPLLLDESLSEEAKYNVLMQCTGLTDKKGKLIYEGDIVQRNGELLIVRYQKELACFAPQHFHIENDKIVYCGREWFEEYTSKDHELYAANCYEVIGNIYIDSHLLDISNNL